MPGEVEEAEVEAEEERDEVSERLRVQEKQLATERDQALQQGAEEERGRLRKAVLSEATVEAVARLQCERAVSWGHHETWEDLHPETRASYLKSAEADLEAALDSLEDSGE